MNSKTDVFIFMGPPGAGKGSLANLCAKSLGWVQLSTGNLCRKHIAEQTEIGKQIDFAIKSGKLVSDSLVTSVVDEWFSSNIGKSPAVILDGFPRTIAQAKALDELLKRDEYALVRLVIVRLSVSDEAVIARLCNRYICSNVECQLVYSVVAESALVSKKHMVCDSCEFALIRRKDDEEHTIRERLKIYHKYEQELLNFFENTKYSISNFDVERPLTDIFNDFSKLVGLESK